MPRHPGKHAASRKIDGRYADDVMHMFRRETSTVGTRLSEYEAKIFGGGNMMRSKGDNIEDSIGSKNAAAAMTLLMEEGVNVLVAHVGEFGHRRLVFDTSSGDVWVRHIDSDENNKGIVDGRV